MEKNMLELGIVDVADRRSTIFQAGIFAQAVTATIGDIERRIGKDIVEMQVFELVFMEVALVVPANVCIDTAHGQVHLGEPPRRVIAFLSINGNVADTAAMPFDEFFRLHEHAVEVTARMDHSRGFCRAPTFRQAREQRSVGYRTPLGSVAHVLVA
jgi:hypothetical protein